VRRHEQLRTLGVKGLRAFLTIVAGLAVGTLLLLIFGYPPLQIMISLVRSVFASRVGLIDTTLQTIPILMIAVGVSLCYRGKMWNIGGEGQFYIGAVFSSAVALTFVDLPRWVLLPSVLLAGALGGALWAGIAGALRAYRGVNEVVVTLMLNSVAVFLTSWAVRLPLRDVGSPVEQTASFPAAAQMPLLGGSRVHTGLFIALLLVPLAHFFLFRTGAGYRIRMVGENPDAARAAGVQIKSVVVSTFLIAGSLAGLAGAVHVTGVTRRLLIGVSSGFGTTAILVALMARLSPVVAVPVAFLFTALTVGGEAVQVQYGLSVDFMKVFLGVLLLCVLAVEELQKRRE
jgi:ABC-type uncharacterized transport system permease subunit